MLALASQLLIYYKEKGGMSRWTTNSRQNTIKYISRCSAIYTYTYSGAFCWFCLRKYYKLPTGPLDPFLLLENFLESGETFHAGSFLLLFTKQTSAFRRSQRLHRFD